MAIYAVSRLTVVNFEIGFRCAGYKRDGLQSGSGVLNAMRRMLANEISPVNGNLYRGLKDTAMSESNVLVIDRDNARKDYLKNILEFAECDRVLVSNCDNWEQHLDDPETPFTVFLGHWTPLSRTLCFSE